LKIFTTFAVPIIETYIMKIEAAVGNLDGNEQFYYIKETNVLIEEDEK